MTADTFLSPAEVADLTHRVRHQAQLRALTRMGVPHTVRIDGTAVVLRRYINAALGAEEPPTRHEQQPNWEHI